jgi:formylglycine-generating enzyme required for sulfatase activity
VAEPHAFLSYTHFDDDFHGGAITKLRTRLEDAVRAVTGKPFRVFQDKEGIELGQSWPERLDEALTQARFLIPIITPSYYGSAGCRDELEKFLQLEQAAERQEFVLPVLYLETWQLSDAEHLRDDRLVFAISKRQWHDWRAHADIDPSDPKALPALKELARKIGGALRKVEEAARRRAEEDERRRRAEEEAAARKVEEERRAAEAQAARRKVDEEAATKRKAEDEAAAKRKVEAARREAEAEAARRRAEEDAAARKVEEERRTAEAQAARRKAEVEATSPPAKSQTASPARPPSQMSPRLVSGTVFRDVDAPWCPEMVVVPAGTFMMGFPGTRRWWQLLDGDARPQHEVTIAAPFALGRYTATFAEYDHFCEATGREKPEDAGWGRGRRPVINVSWEDAQAYCGWLSEQTGQPYRLPSEAEWEYACRAGTATPFWTGATISTEQANYDGNSTYGAGKKGAYRKRTVPVDESGFLANAFGLSHMHGNVWEWCADVWHASYEGAPGDGSAWLQGGDSSRRVLRGGSWYNDPRSLRSALRLRLAPEFRSSFPGFRVARALTA